MSADLWGAFERYAAWVRSKPTWDAEERDLRLAAAPRLREAIERAAGRGDWESALWDCVCSPEFGRADLVRRGHVRWLQSWRDAEERLRAGLAAFADAGATPVERYGRWARIASEAVASGLVEDRADALLAIGALFNFALDPERVAFVLHGPYVDLPPLLGEQPGAGYEAHLRFAETTGARLIEAGIARDMIDATALILSGARNAAFWVPGAGDERGGARPVAPQHYLAVCAIYKDEASYMHEWIEFHRLVGVEHFYLYDNNSTDDHREVLAPYIERGEVTLRDWPMETRQPQAYQDCVERHAQHARWIAFIDLDEFLFSPTGRPLPEVLRRYERWPGVGVNWAVFGSSGHATRPAGPVTESYVVRLWTPENRTIKTIADPVRVAGCPGVHRFQYTELGTVDENEYPIWGGQTKSESRSVLQINHYMTKSLEEYRLRSQRPRPVPAPGQEQHRRKFDPDRVAAFERLGERDEAILQYVPALRNALDPSRA